MNSFNFAVNQESVVSKPLDWLHEIAQACALESPEAIHPLFLEERLQYGSVIEQLLDEGLVAEDQFYALLAAKIGMPYLDSELVPDDPVVLREALPAAIAIKHQIVPVSIEGGVLRVACSDPLAFGTRQAVTRYVSHPVSWVLARRRFVRSALSNLYGVGADTFEKILAGRGSEQDHSGDHDEMSILDDDVSDEASVLRFVNQIIKEGLSQNATDIHVEPQRDALRIRYRVDGYLADVPVPEKINALKASVIARLKIMAQLDIAERRSPQDGRISLQNLGKNIDVRVATVPSVDGETISLRLLNQQRFDLARLDLEPHILEEILKILALPNGVILATGPTGSGKSTSLYCFLENLNLPETRIVTIEDPVENKLPGIVQIAVRPEVGLTFAKGLRSILRADPNIVMIGEIRDTETAEIAIRASLTGHLVFSTLHTNTAIGGVIRLLDMNVEKFLVAASVRAFLAQRLVRKLCEHCKVPLKNWDQAAAKNLGAPQAERFIPQQAVGCTECRKTGFDGRIALYEIFVVTEDVQDLINGSADENSLLSYALANGYETMRDYGWRKIAKGLTTIEEVLSATS